jgi:hypothetical protein
MFIEAITFLGNQERDRNLYAIPGLDYVAHEDVIPYTVICFIKTINCLTIMIYRHLSYENE